MLSNQEVFDRVYTYAKTMKNPAINEEGNCLYRSPNGPCLIGSLIKDEFYHECLEDQHTGTENVIEALRQSGIVLEDTEFLQMLQTAHDEVVMDSSEDENFNLELIANLKAIAKKYKLEIPE